MPSHYIKIFTYGAQMSVISYPTPLLSNFPIQPQNYAPRQYYISNITLGQTTTITTTVDHNYVIGQQCRLIIPQSNGTFELNGVSGYVQAIPTTNQVVLNIFSNGFTAFKTSTFANQPQIVAIGDINYGNIQNNGRLNFEINIPGSFNNVSP